MAAEENQDTIMDRPDDSSAEEDLSQNGDIKEKDDLETPKASAMAAESEEGSEDGDLEAQMASAMAAESEAGSEDDDIEAQMAATMALEGDMDGGELDLEAQMATAMEDEGGGDMGNGLDQDDLGDGDSDVAVQPLDFPQLQPSDESVDGDSIDRLMDVSLNISVELGRKQMQIKEILGLGPGKIIELDKLAGEPVDLLVNGKLLAKGEVVVIDENFGVRITDLVDPKDRIKMI